MQNPMIMNPPPMMTAPVMPPPKPIRTQTKKVANPEADCPVPKEIPKEMPIKPEFKSSNAV
jgi:hypothetical protein